MEGCIKPPKGSPTSYEYAHVGETITADGDSIKTAVIAGGIPHPDNNAPADLVPNIYANTGHQVMRVRYGQDDNGLWFAGALFPNLAEHEVATIRASALSGDWRWQTQFRKDNEGAYDFSGAIMVNIPGYRVETDGLLAGRSETIMASSKPIEETMSDKHEPIIATSEESTCGGGGGGCGCGGDKKAEAESLETIVAALSAKVDALTAATTEETITAQEEGEETLEAEDTSTPVEEPVDTEAAVTLEKLADLVTEVIARIEQLEEALIVQPALDQLANELSE